MITLVFPELLIFVLLRQIRTFMGSHSINLGSSLLGKYLSTINYTSKPLLRQTAAVISKQ